MLVNCMNKTKFVFRKREFWINEIMRYVVTCIFFLVLSSSAFGNEEPECPNRGTDPSKFCLPGQTWNEEMEKCVNLV